MRIAITADPYLPVPPRHYGGIERVVDFLARGLLERGHDVTLIAHPESETPARLVPYGAPPHRGWAFRMRELVQVGTSLRRRWRDLDLIHSFGRLAALLPVLCLKKLPKIQSYQRAVPRSGIRRALRLAGDSLQFTACSTQMYAGKGLEGRWTTVFNGVELTRYEFVPSVSPGAPLVFLGRLERIKGVHSAIAIARTSGRRLILAGNRVAPSDEPDYFESEIAPALDGDRVRYVGEVDDARKNAILGEAAALLMPIEWEEPFGIVMIEAMACGTPVIAFDRGSVGEIVRDGVNGFVCSGVREAVEAVDRLERLDRAGARRDVEKRFSSEVIVDAYERLYEDAVACSNVREPVR